MNNVAEIEKVKEIIFLENESSNFTECSKDTSGDVDVSLVTDSSITAYNYDDICANIYSKVCPNSNQPRSVDALCISEDNKIFLVEFKNSVWGNIKSDEIKLKIFETIGVLRTYCDVSHEVFNGTVVYIVHQPDPGVPITNRKYTNGKCPKQLRLLEEILKIKIVRYAAEDFENYIQTKNSLPKVV